MASIADKLATIDPGTISRKGPLPSCEVYGKGDLDDFLALHELRGKPRQSWATVQVATEDAAGTPRIKPDHFRYHWWGKCAHWDYMRDEIEALRAEMLGRA